MYIEGIGYTYIYKGVHRRDRIYTHIYIYMCMYIEGIGYTHIYIYVHRRGHKNQRAKL